MSAIEKFLLEKTEQWEAEQAEPEAAPTNTLVLMDISDGMDTRYGTEFVQNGDWPEGWSHDVPPEVAQELETLFGKDNRIAIFVDLPACRHFSAIDNYRP